VSFFNVPTSIADNGIGVKEVAEGNLDEGAKYRSLLAAVVRVGKHRVREANGELRGVQKIDQ
jgi:hypothetical protein